jgi:hypothetical protein
LDSACPMIFLSSGTPEMIPRGARPLHTLNRIGSDKHGTRGPRSDIDNGRAWYVIDDRYPLPGVVDGMADTAFICSFKGNPSTRICSFVFLRHLTRWAQLSIRYAIAIRSGI